MGIKSKLIGIGAASLLALSMTTGVMAQTTDSDSTAIGVELKAGACSLEITAGTDINFGEWRWNGSNAYEYWGGASSNTISGTVKNHKPGGTCTITVASNGLTSGSNSISPANLIGNLTTPSVSGTLASPRTGVLGAGNYSGTLQLNNVGSLGAAPGTYSGTLNFTLSNAN